MDSFRTAMRPYERFIYALLAIWAILLNFAWIGVFSESRGLLYLQTFAFVLALVKRGLAIRRKRKLKIAAAAQIFQE